MVSLSLGKRRRILMTRAQKTEEDKKLIEEWLKTNEVTICPAEETTPDEELVYKYRAGKRGKKQ